MILIKLNGVFIWHYCMVKNNGPPALGFSRLRRSLILFNDVLYVVAGNDVLRVGDGIFHHLRIRSRSRSHRTQDRNRSWERERKKWLTTANETCGFDVLLCGPIKVSGQNNRKQLNAENAIALDQVLFCALLNNEPYIRALQFPVHWLFLNSFLLCCHIVLHLTLKTSICVLNTAVETLLIPRLWCFLALENPTLKLPDVPCTSYVPCFLTGFWPVITFVRAGVPCKLTFSSLPWRRSKIFTLLSKQRNKK